VVSNGGIAKGLGDVVGGIAGGFQSGAGLENQYQPVQSQIESKSFLILSLKPRVATAGFKISSKLWLEALLAQSQGQGPNPAQEMLKQQTQANIKGAAGWLQVKKVLTQLWPRGLRPNKAEC